MTNIFEFAPRVTQLNGASGGNTATLVSGEPVRVWGYVLTETGGNTATVDIQTATATADVAAGTSLIIHHTTADSNTVVDIKFIADAGLQVVFSGTNPEDSQITILHSHPGS